MTVIACDPRAGEIACDSLAVAGEKRSYVRKFRYLLGNKILFVAGSYKWMSALVLHIGGGHKPTRVMLDECDIVVFDTKKNHMYYYDDDGEYKRIKKPMAFGSGHAYALGSLMTGGSAEYAAKVAATHDNSCGGKIHVFRRDDAKPSGTRTGSVPVRKDPDAESNPEQRGEGTCTQ